MFGGVKGVGGVSQSLGSVPRVMAAHPLSAPADTATAAGRVDEGQARALASTGWEVTLVTSLPSLQEESMKEKKLFLS